LHLVHFRHISEEEAGTERNFQVIFGYVITFNGLDLRALSRAEERKEGQEEGWKEDISSA